MMRAMTDPASGAAATDYEPFVADPAETPAQAKLARLRPVIAWLAVVILVAGLTAMWAISRDDQDPSLVVPEHRLQTEPDESSGEVDPDDVDPALQVPQPVN